MKKRIVSLLLALLLAAGFSCSVSALIAVQDETGVRYSDDEIVETTTQPSALSRAAKKAMESFSAFWHRFGVVTVIVLLLASIVVAIVISEFERQKKEARPPEQHSKKKKK